MIRELQVPIVAAGAAALMAVDDFQQIPMQARGWSGPNLLTGRQAFYHQNRWRPRSRVMKFLDYEEHSAEVGWHLSMPGVPPFICVIDGSKGDYISRDEYIASGFKPDVDVLPWESEYRTSKKP
ncbi:hypothetical protein [Mesorhizobium sp. WSM3859]|uniref:hypothetical protein n=1 Tax=Mesorhizobium sp. WSM3859 TaxID=2029402 RepID=UPI000BAE89F7|nr:hypothetical protein [Mesorhizobium sp. WSM3859]PBC11802.1 hypothetical protein CK230_00055 [Mesorhizobium sp. WSM3859]